LAPRQAETTLQKSRFRVSNAEEKIEKKGEETNLTKLKNP